MEIVERRGRKAYKVKVIYQYDIKAINKKDVIVDRVLGKTNPSKKTLDPITTSKPVDVVKEESRFFDNRWYSFSEAKLHNLDWIQGLTSSEMMKQMTNKFKT